MVPDLLSRTVTRRPETLRVQGRVLFLLDDARLMEAQLDHGVDLPFDNGVRARLRDQISTDEITPAYICYFYDETLGEFPYLGLRATESRHRVRRPSR
jgi:3-isopropylmalate/(R)-2-methylmalate dehydratase large subunit